MKCTNQKAIIPNGHVKPITVPCGKCIPCLMKKRADWSFRLVQEWKVSKSAMFVTLTYDRPNLKKANYQLQKKHIQLFIKRVRKHAKHIRIRYYAVGEYGTQTKRPHYHVILFNANENLVRKSWDRGIIHIGMVNEASITYTLKYVVQPEAKIPNLNPPFALMSRGYGIGGHYLTYAMIDWHRSGDKNYTLINGEKKALPRFYKEKIWPKETIINGLLYDYGKKRISDKAKLHSIKQYRNEMREWKKLFGNDWKQKRAEHQKALIEKVKLKVQYTQKL